MLSMFVIMPRKIRKSSWRVSFLIIRMLSKGIMKLQISGFSGH